MTAVVQILHDSNGASKDDSNVDSSEELAALAEK